MALPFFVSSVINKDELICDQLGGSDRSDFLTINRSKKCVVWYSALGNRVIRLFSFPKEPQCAVFCQFRTPTDILTSSSMKNAVAVIMSSVDLCINMFTGEVYNIKLPCAVRQMIAIPSGLLFQSHSSRNNCNSLLFDCVELLPLFFSLSNPSSPLMPVNIAEFSNDDCMADITIKCIDKDILCTYSESRKALLMFHISENSRSLHDFSLASSISPLKNKMESALDIIDGSTSQYHSIMPTKQDAMSMLMLSDSFQTNANESSRPDRFIESVNSSVSFRRSLGGERSLSDFKVATPHSRGIIDTSRTSPVHMLLSRDDPFRDTPYSTPILPAMMDSEHPSGNRGKPYGPTIKETSSQPYHLSYSADNLMSGSAFQRSSHSLLESNNNSLPMNISKNSVSRADRISAEDPGTNNSQQALDPRQPGECVLVLVQSIPLPEGMTKSVQCSFSGHQSQVGGLLLHCLDVSSLYVCYSVEKNINHPETIDFQLLHSFYNYSSSSHMTLNLDDTSHSLETDRSALLGVGSHDQIPVTILFNPLEIDTGSLIIGRSIIGKIPLIWSDDLDEDSLVCGIKSISSLHKNSSHVIVKTLKDDQLILATSTSLFNNELNSSNHLVSTEIDLLKAIVAHCGTSNSTFVGQVIGLLLFWKSSFRCSSFLALLCSSIGVQFSVFLQYSLSHNLAVDGNSADAKFLMDCYNNIISCTLTLTTNKLDFVHLVHVLLQEYLLRFGKDDCITHCLRDSLTHLMQLLASNSLSHLAGQYFAIYNPFNPVGAKELSSRHWLFRCLDCLQFQFNCEAEMQDFPVLQPLNGVTLYSFPTIKLTSLFFKNLSKNYTNVASPNFAIMIVNAFVESITNKFADKSCNANLDWSSLLGLMPNLLRTLIQLSLDQCSESPCLHWPDFVLKEIGRNDLCVIGSDRKSLDRKLNTKGEDVTTSDGLKEVENSAKLRFTEDDRMHEVCRMLRSSVSVYLKLEKAPEVSDFDHKAKQQQKLLCLCRRLLACPVGRGMLTMSTLEPLIAEALPIPILALSGRVAPTKVIMELETSIAPPDFSLWPEFHNGVAASLRVGPQITNSSRSSSANSSKVTRNWILYNRTASQAKAGGESSHAGFLYGLGLHGHLSVLSVTDICDYLVQGHEPTTIAILLGCTASKVGSADPLLSKTLSLHLPALLPAQHWDIEISPLVQTAALVGMGLLHCSTGHRVMTEFLLAELSRKPTSDRCESREAMILASCWSIGMLLLSKGNDKSYNPKSKSPIPLKGASILGGLADLRVEERLLLHVDGGKKPAESSLFPSQSSSVDVSSKSSRVLEGDDINVDVTAPGACIALALIYLRSNNAEILNRLQLPSTLIQLDSIRPDLLMFKTVTRSLIMWDSVEPSEEWIHSQIPSIVLKSVFTEVKSKEELSKAKVDTLFDGYNKSRRRCNQQLEGKTAFSLYLNMISGYCWGIGLVYAGTFDERAKKTIMDKLLLLQSFRDNKPQLKVSFTMDKSLRYTLEMCIGIVSMSLSCVMAGSGDLVCLRLLRELRFRVEDAAYGTHMAIAMSIGLLFLAGGNSSLRRDPLSTACLLLAMCPRFPARSLDHQYHLQPLRHLYVLAAEHRALHTIDVDTGLPVSLFVDVELTNGSRMFMKAPGLLPELNTVRRVSVSIESQLKQQLTIEGSNADEVELFYPTTLEITSHDDKINSNSQQSFSYDRDFHRTIHSQIHVPNLLVKRVPPKDSVGTSSVEHVDAVESVKILIQKSLDSMPPKLTVRENSVSGMRRRRVLLENLLSDIKESNSEDVNVGEILLRCKPFLDIVIKSTVKN